MNKKNVAIYLSGVNNITGGGGVERFFSDFFTIYIKYPKAKFQLYFFIDQSTFEALKEVNKLSDSTKNIVILKNISNRFKKAIENWDFDRKLKKYKIDVIHCANYGRHDFSRLIYISQKSKKPKLVQNIVDCQIPYVLSDKSAHNYNGYFKRYVEQPNAIQFDGIYTWYELYIHFFKENNLLSDKVIVKNITSRFANTEAYKPGIKQKQFVFASRLNSQKRPDWFVKAVHVLKERSCDISDWEFLLFGNGEMEKEIAALILDLNLTSEIKMLKSGDLSNAFSVSSCYVSTQDYENFPSLSMMEAMAAGNIIIARNVGQTNLMVKDGYNGIMLKSDSSIGLAESMEYIIYCSDDQRNQMMKNSLNMINEVHTPEAFISQIECFWEELLMN